ncbi:hypothetical protein ElyMa_002984300 [Elysia marginata]|uniref:Uncharacterized protein n=1 Tax=Elysia marginata TaxID=1093978 RepID=A0AAV4IBA5_9GAST|nr:hypothetical protein ElyMa_002984300 [Elysia marginata]
MTVVVQRNCSRPPDRLSAIAIPHGCNANRTYGITARYRNFFDMNWLHALLFSNGFGANSGGAGAMGGALPWLLFGNM